MMSSRPANPSPPFRGEREGPGAERWEGEVGASQRSGIPHLTPALSAPRGRRGRNMPSSAGIPRETPTILNSRIALYDLALPQLLDLGRGVAEIAKYRV